MSETNENIVIRPPSEEEFPEVFRLRSKMLNMPHGMAAQTQPSPADLNPNAVHLGAFDENGALEGTIRVVPYEGVYLLERLAAAHPGHGVGRKLVEAAEQIAKANKAERLEANAPSDGAIAFFKALGFHAVAVKVGSPNNRNMVKDL